MGDRNFTRRFDVVMTSLSSDKKIMVQQCYTYAVRGVIVINIYICIYITSNFLEWNGFQRALNF